MPESCPRSGGQRSQTLTNLHRKLRAQISDRQMINCYISYSYKNTMRFRDVVVCENHHVNVKCPPE